MNFYWHDVAWEDYLYWQMQDKKTLKKVNNLLKDIDRNIEKNLSPMKKNFLSEIFLELVQWKIFLKYMFTFHFA